MQEFSIEEKLLLIEGSLTAYSLAEGLDCLRKANIYEKGMYYQAFFSLSIGIERLLKLIIIYDYRANNNGAFPENKEIKEKGHNLYNSIINFLSDFARTTRYYNLDVLTGEESQKLNPLGEWNYIERMILKEYNAEIKITPNKNILVNNLNQITDVVFLDMNLNAVSNAMYIVNEIEERDIIQGYSVLTFYKIISALVNILTECEIKNNLFPCIREFFSHFRANYTDGEIRRKKGWRNIVKGY